MTRKSSLPGLSRQSILVAKSLRKGWIRGSSPRMTNRRIGAIAMRRREFITLLGGAAACVAARGAGAAGPNGCGGSAC